MNRLFRTAVAVLMIAGVALAGDPSLVWGQNSGSQSGGQLPTIRFGTLPAESAIPLIIAKETGQFRDANVQVELVPFNSPTDRNVAAQAGQIDGFIADVMTAVTLREAGFPVKMTSDINEDFKILTAPGSGIDSFAKLDGKDVSLVPNFVLEYIMDVFAQRNGIHYHAVVIPSISARFEALLSGRISAVVFTEPQASLLEARGSHVLADSREAGISGGAIVFTDKAISGKADAIRRFYSALRAAIASANGRPMSDYTAMMTRYGFPSDQVNALRGALTFDLPQPVSEATFSSIIEWMKQKGTLAMPITLNEVSDFTFLR